MPIKINLLAEAQALEELRRKDPVKRAVWMGALLGLAMLVWSSSLWLKAMIAKGELSRIESGLASRTNDYAHVLENQKELREVREKLTALQQLASNRFLNGNMLDALQRATLENVQLTRVKAAVEFRRQEGTKPQTNGNRLVPGKPATVTEKITLTLEARDFSPMPGDAVNRFKQVIADTPYFHQALASTNDVLLKQLDIIQPGPDGRPCQPFTLECLFPEKTR